MSVCYDKLWKICKALDCNIGDIMEFTDDEASAQ